VPKFKYRIYTEEGSLLEQEGEYPNQEVLIADLQSKGYTIINILPIEEKEKGPGIKLKLPFGGKVSDRDISIVCRQMSAMVSAGVSVVDAAKVIGESMPNKKLSNALLEVAKLISEGSSISNAMRKFNDVFPSFVINLVVVGEETGNLDLALSRAADYYERMAMIKSKIKSAMFYPVFVLVVAIVILVGILYFLVPVFADLYKSLGGELPLPTQMLINASNAFRSNFLFIASFFGGTWFIFTYLYKNNYNFRKSIHALSLRLPKLRDLVVKSVMAKWARTMATLFASGVAIEKAFEIAGEVAGNILIRESMDEARKGVIEGKPISKAIEETKLFPQLIIAMLKVGEDTGRLDDMLDTIANFYEDEFNKVVEGMIKLIEPMLMVFIGGIVGIVLVALYLPIFKMGELIK